MLFRSDRKSTRLNSSHTLISYAVFCLKKKKKKLRGGGEIVQGSTDLRRVRLYLRACPVFSDGAHVLRAAMVSPFLISFAFFFNDTATTEIYTLSLHDALPI